MALLKNADDFIDRCGKGHEIHTADRGKNFAEQAESFPQGRPRCVNIEKEQMKAVFSNSLPGKIQSNGQDCNDGEYKRNSHQRQISVA